MFANVGGMVLETRSPRMNRTGEESALDGERAKSSFSSLQHHTAKERYTEDRAPLPVPPSSRLERHPDSKLPSRPKFT